MVSNLFKIDHVVRSYGTENLAPYFCLVNYLLSFRQGRQLTVKIRLLKSLAQLQSGRENKVQLKSIPVMGQVN
jgi:hypothetical protein